MKRQTVNNRKGVRMVLLTSLYVVRINEEKISEDIKDTPKRYKVCNTYERRKLLHVGTFLNETI